MSVTDVAKDFEARTLTVTAEFDSAPEAVWQVFADPRKLERWWGPPTYPATVIDHDLTPGGAVTYFMTGPEGDKHHGWWRVLAVQAPQHLEFEDGFGEQAGTPAPGTPVVVALVTLTGLPQGGTRLQLRTSFPSAEAMEQLVRMGMDQGLREALGQLDAVLAAG